MGSTLFEKIWDQHSICDLGDGNEWIYIDRIFLHERTGSIAPKSLVSKITVVKSREVAAPLLVKMGIIGDKDEIPTFLGGDFVHDDKLTKSLSGMLSSLN